MIALYNFANTCIYGLQGAIYHFFSLLYQKCWIRPETWHRIKKLSQICSSAWCWCKFIFSHIFVEWTEMSVSWRKHDKKHMYAIWWSNKWNSRIGPQLIFFYKNKTLKSIFVLSFSILFMRFQKIWLMLAYSENETEIIINFRQDVLIIVVLC